MKTYFLPFLLVLCLSGQALAEDPLTLEKIMSHPRWIGMWPESVTYSPHGTSIFYKAHADPRGYEVVEIDRQGEVMKVYETDSLPSWEDRRGDRAIYTFMGDIFLKVKGASRQFTSTVATESQTRWLDGDRFTFRREGQYFIFDLKAGVERQIAELKFEEAPQAGEDFRSRQQDRLFPALREREERERERKRARGIPVFYLGAERDLVRLEMTNDGRHALLVHGASSTGDRDQMPVYLNRDGTVSFQTLRPKVGEKEPSDHRLTILDLQDGSQSEIDLTTLPGFKDSTLIRYGESKWSEEGRLALSLFSENHEERWIVEVDFVDATVELIEHLHDDAWHTWDLNEFGWVPKRDALWFQSERSGYAHLYVWENGGVKALTSGSYEVSSIHPEPRGSGFYYRSNRGDASVYEVYFTGWGGDTEKLTSFGGNLQFDLAPDGEELVVLHSQTAVPPEISLQRASGGARPRRLTRFAGEEFLSVDWTLPEFVKVPSTHHRRSIPSKLYLPPDGVEPSGAAVVFVHGAGYLQNADRGWSYYFREFMFHTLLTRKGVVVLDMDYRASAGYGRDWRAAIYRRMGTPELEDLKDGVAYLIQNHGVDRRRVGVYGGSYGGFMTLMALFKEPDLFACGAALRPVTDWAQYEHGYTSRILNTPDEDPEAYLRSSPIEYAEGLSKPLLMCHGMLDDNVVAQDTVRLTQRLIQLKKKDWETALYPLEPHGFMEPESWYDEYRRILKLFRENLKI